MDWLVNNPWIIGCVAVGSVVIYVLFNLYLSRKRNGQSRCARCGKELGDGSREVAFDAAPDVDPTLVRMCPKCAVITEKNHRPILIMVDIGFVAYMAARTLDIVSGWRSNHHVGWQNAVILAALVAAVVNLAYGSRGSLGSYFAGRRRNPKESRE